MPNRNPAEANEQALKARIAQAKAEALKAPFDDLPGPEWPSVDTLSVQEALVELTVQMYTLGAKISFGCNSEATSVWGRINFPKWSSNREVAGMSALTFSGDVERACRKLAQLVDEPVTAKFRPDPYAK